MIYYNIACYGDSQTFGARSYGCYPLFLARQLRDASKTTEYRTINRSVNGYTARDLWFKLNEEIDSITDTQTACIMIGTNDVRKQTEKFLYKEYLRQIVLAFKIKGYNRIYVGGIPPIIHKDFDPFYPKYLDNKRLSYERCIKEVCADLEVVFVPMDNLSEKHYVDSVHFNEKGNELVARNFGEAMVKE